LSNQRRRYISEFLFFIFYYFSGEILPVLDFKNSGIFLAGGGERVVFSVNSTNLAKF
jgi:hypothetical protein